MDFLRTNHFELAQQSTKDTAGKGGPSETHFGQGEVNSKCWRKGSKLEEDLCLVLLGEHEREGFLLQLVFCSTVG